MINGTPGIAYGSTAALLFRNYIGKMNFLSTIFTDEFTTHIAQQAISSAICAVIGGTIGFFIHLFWSKLIKKNDRSNTIS